MTPSTPARKFAVTPEILNLVVVAFILLADNKTMFAKAWALSPSAKGLAVFTVTAFAANLISVTIFTIFNLPVLQRLALSVLLVLSACTAYFTDQLGIVYDHDMLANVIGTNMRETNWFVDLPFLAHLGLWGGVPALAIWAIPLRRRGHLMNGAAWVGVFLAAALAFVGARAVGRPEFVALGRRNIAALTLSLQPAAFLWAGASVAYDSLQTIGKPFRQIGLDAKQGPVAAKSPKPIVIFLVVGESARADHQGYNHYPRDTTPNLSKLDLLNFGTAQSCATSTRPSVRCMFSGLGQSKFSYAAFATQENLLDVAAHAGEQVEWFNNNWSPNGLGVAERIKVTTLYDDLGSPFCRQRECVDGILAAPVAKIIAETRQNTLVILHLAGSHFPYADRYPADQAPFQPACADPVFLNCPADQIVNAYDNSIAYSDKVLGGIIHDLQSQDRIIPALMYTSDHGESLGENGRFAHSAPLAEAPPEQTAVPFFLWLSQDYQTLFGIDRTCIQAKSKGQVGHDNFFHTALGLMDIETAVRTPALDLIDGCKKPG